MIFYIEFKFNGITRFSFFDDEINQFVNFKGMNAFKDMKQFEAAAGKENFNKYTSASNKPEPETLKVNFDESYSKRLSEDLKDAEKREDYTECERIKNEILKINGNNTAERTE